MTKLILMAGAALAVASVPAIAKPGHHNDRSHSWRYDARNCPPGLAKKNNGCLPPGIAKKRYEVGQRYASRYGHRWSYNQIPLDLRQRYDLSAGDRYYYRDGYLYRVNPRTLIVEQVLNALTRPY
ncbi:MAG: hypothetical protein ACTHN4_09895 [Sphingomicrobium sp.]